MSRIEFGEYNAEQDDIARKVQEAREAFEALSSVEQAAHLLKQKRSFIHGSASFSDPTTREERDARIDKLPEFVILAAFREAETQRDAAIARAKKAEREVAELRARLTPDKPAHLERFGWTEADEDLPKRFTATVCFPEGPPSNEAFTFETIWDRLPVCLAKAVAPNGEGQDA